MYADELYTLIQMTNGRFFSVRFVCRTPAKDDNGNIVEPAGRERRMLCRIGVHAFKKGIIPDEVRAAEDLRHALITCWDCEHFFALREQGVPRRQAGERSYRRINLLGVQECTAIEDYDELPVRLRPHVHRITNGWQIAQLAAQGVAPDGTPL